ncbi:cell cycle control protein [Stemphylium lycopersici]|nr:cell cycle control protein [Stemphylium lycopersici]RAR05123.1 cell cycle control protein [Stemphylium lycopersici]
MTATFRRRHNFNPVPTYSHGPALATPQLPYHHAFSASRHHVAAQHVNMAGDEVGVNARTCQMNVDGQQREDSYSPDDTPPERQEAHHSPPAPQNACMAASPASALHPARSHAADGQFDMLPPPNHSVHASWQALHDYAQSHASEHGYALSINTTAKNRSRIKLACVCYGQPKNTHKLTAETRVRKNRVSYKTGCKMWIEGKKLDDGKWLLRVGESQHNHAGRESAGWAVQRKRTWGVVGGRIGVGGVTAKEELAKLSLPDSKDTLEDMDAEAEGDNYPEVYSLQQPQQKQTTQKPAAHSLERGGLVWKIVEQEMLRKGGPNQGRDRGVGRTVDVLQARLPGIHIFKRDVYNIRAQIKRARKAAGQQLGDGLYSSDDDVEASDAAAAAAAATTTTTTTKHDSEPNHALNPSHPQHPQPPSIYQAPLPQQRRPPSMHYSSKPRARPLTRKDSRIDPSLDDVQPPPPSDPSQATAMEVDQLRRENAELRRMLTEKTKEVKEKSIEMAGLRSQVELLSNMMLTSGRGLLAG